MPLLLILLLAVFTTPSVGQKNLLSEEAQLSVLTCAPWQGELYTAFGHSAIRVYDPQWGINHVFNYGVFDFNQPHFYLNFTKGNLLYELNVSLYSDFIYAYIYRNRTVTEQVLALTQSQKQRVFDFLQWNAQPENKGYFYDYFYDNCATRIRDVFVETLADELVLDSAFIQTDYTIRDLAEIYLSHQPWGDLGIDICLGLPMDKQAAAYGYMFLPDYIALFFDRATLVSTAGKRPLVAEKKNVFEAAPEQVPPQFWHPWVIFGVLLLAVVGVSLYDFRRNKLSTILDAVLLSATGLLGCLLIVLWAGTNHKAAAYNFNLLWALPSNLIVVFLLWGRQRAVAQYFRILFLATIALLLAWAWLPQQLNIFLLPLVLALGLRYGVNYWIRIRNPAAL